MANDSPEQHNFSQAKHHLSLQEARHLELQAGIVWKTGVASVIVIASNVFGSYCLARGLRTIGVIESWSPIPYIHAFANPWVSVGVVFMIGWLVSRLALLSWADLSYVLPVTAFSYVLSAIVGAKYFNERVNAMHWMGISLITLGVALVALTPPETLEEDGQQ
ncbi:MAG TPA: EamA family transporter [Terriglobales bacterium]|nr:EamA family transporter [Terriglobales bacterium]